MKNLPPPDTYSLEMAAEYLSDIYGETVTTEWLEAMSDSNKIEIYVQWVGSLEGLGERINNGTAQVRSWLYREELERFVADNPPKTTAGKQGEIEINDDEGSNAQHRRKKQTPIELVIQNYLESSGGTGGEPGLWDYMVSEVGAKRVAGDKWEWTDAAGKTQRKSIGTLKNQLSNLRKKREKQP